MAFTVAPIRLVFVFTFIILASIVANISVMGLPLEPAQPLSGWRL